MVYTNSRQVINTINKLYKKKHTGQVSLSTCNLRHTKKAMFRLFCVAVGYTNSESPHHTGLETS